MQQRSIDFIQLFKYGFQQYKKYFSFVVGIMITYYVLAIVPQVYLMIYSPKDPSTELQIVSGIFLVIQLFLSLGFIKVMFRLIDNEHVEVVDLFNNVRPFFSYFVAYFLYAIAVVLGTLLFVIPGIFIAIRFQFYPYFVLNGTHSSILALQKSYYLTENLTLDLFLFGLSVIGLNIAGVFFLGIGIIFTYPLTTMATAMIYQSLRSESKQIPAERYQV